MSDSRVIGVIPARGGSKGIPRKNLADVAGKPLIAHMIGHALVSRAISDVVVSTDDEEIAAVARLFGALVPFMRPRELAGDSVASLPVVQHAVTAMESERGERYDVIVLLQATAPLCRPADITSCLAKLASDSTCKSCVTVTPVATHPFRMKRIIDDDRLVNYIDQGFEDMRPRQALPPVYRRAGSVYASRRAVVMDDHTLVGDPCRAVQVPPETAVDIDTPLDLALVRLMLTSTTPIG
jgi:CMP-N,N'-diacetyllegionaminic acid synthase